MKLKKITLSGFKSFVDRTTIELLSNLTGMVGPNGCGKSNIIDAVRWVMGEISAKQLRGQSMTDVIFNGSSQRKSVGQASVELVFDNSDASLGGQYAEYREISIRREVNRDGFSDYYLNNASCRRKDIINVFLGTGLGTNSYAIVEQGMITQFIEAKPDELRVVIEEAAGISKYKERRRETENRIKHTKENLSRLNDILEELSKQLKHLRSQANAAERYRKFKEEERLAKAELCTLHWMDINKRVEDCQISIASDETKLEDNTSGLHATSAKISEVREHHHVATESFNQIQAKYYSIGANIARLEQQLQHAKERQDQLTKDLEQLNQERQETISHQSIDQVQVETLTLDKTRIESEAVEMEIVLGQARQELHEAEQKMQFWQTNWENFNELSAKVLQSIEVEQTQIRHLEQKISDSANELEKSKSELSSLDFIVLRSEVDRLSHIFSELKQNREDLHEALTLKQQKITNQREEVGRLVLELDRERNELHILIGRKSSLEALQQAAFGKNDTVLTDWLSQHNLAQKPRLAEKLQVESGWEVAAETVLGVYLEAICVDGIDGIATRINTLARGNLTLLESGHAVRREHATSGKYVTLESKVISDSCPSNLLHGIYVAENISEAMKMQVGLNHGESVVTKDGIWLGPGWLRVTYDSNQKAGVLQRERDLQNINANIEAKQRVCAAKEEHLDKEQGLLVVLEGEHQKLQQEMHLLNAKYSEAQSQVTAKQTYLQHIEQRAQAIKIDIENRENVMRFERERLTEALKSRDDAVRRNAANDSQRQIHLQEKEQLQQKLATSREHFQQLQQDSASLQMRLHLNQTQFSYLTQNLERAGKRLETLEEQRIGVERAMVEARDPLPTLGAELQSELEKRLSIEAEMNAVKQQINEMDYELLSLEQEQTKNQEVGSQIRASLEKLRTEKQVLEVRSSSYVDQVVELGLQLEELKKQIPADVTALAYEEKVAHLAARIERLGLINLAAIEEVEKLQERKQYLEAQNQDLVGALNTLEEAIRKIDHDTKERFKTAYDSINQKFQELFPRMFNGGRACLEFTESSILETGVVIMAQPPGKRNSSIHLLSGGEKALTAIALIFSIFHLTPAPFCMLDEVDAPLDDLNVARFCNLVREMSKTLQFIFVTHNKLTMEMSGQLLGITMQEAGVSRVVAVDIDTAVELAGADK